CRQSGLDYRRVARSGSDSQSATPGPVKPAANQCPRFPSLDRLGLCDTDRLTLSVDRPATSSRTAAPSASAQSATWSSSDFAPGPDGAARFRALDAGARPCAALAAAQSPAC